MFTRRKRWLIPLILIGIILTFVSPRLVYWFSMRGIHEPSRSRDFWVLTDVLPPARAHLTRIYRGLPQQSGDRFTRELFLTRNRSISGYRFYSQPIPTSEAVLDAIDAAVYETDIYQPYSPGKLCGGFHPDYCLEWEADDEKFRALVCLGCVEIIFVGGGGELHCDVASDAIRLFKSRLAALDDPSLLVAPEDERGPFALKRLIVQAGLPRGWAVEFDPHKRWLEVRRDQPVMIEPFASNPALDERAKLDRFSIAFRVGDYRPDLYSRYKAQNAEVREDLEAMKPELEKVARRAGEYVPTNETERRLVAKFKSKSLNHLPDFHFRDVELFWGLPGGEERHKMIADESIRQECVEVTQMVLNLLTRFE